MILTNYRPSKRWYKQLKEEGLKIAFISNKDNKHLTWCILTQE